MKNRLQELINSDRVIYYFSEISKIPRKSGNEMQISNYLKNFAMSNQLDVIQDEFNNILITKNASPGCENLPSVILQGHMDMVCEKNNGIIHDFSKDPLSLIVEGDFLKAQGTTLGADNGIAIAYMLAILEDNAILHPTIEALITTDEEVGLTGAMSFDASLLKGKFFINLDSEEEGEIVISCAGGLRANLELPITKEDLKIQDCYKINIAISGLKGGHSGMEIDKNRLNSILVLGEILDSLYMEFKDIHLEKINGGKKDNVIPRESNATIIIPKKDIISLKLKLEGLAEQIKTENSTSEPDMIIEYNYTEIQSSLVFSKKSFEDLLFLLINQPNGVQTMSPDIAGLVESSLNLGKLKQEESIIIFEFAIRSAVKSKKYKIVRRLELFALHTGGKLTTSKDYPEWPLKKDSYLLELVKKIYTKTYSKLPLVKGIHAGLESGVFLEKKPELEAVSIGPDIFDVHSPDEKMSISSLQRTYKLLLDILEEMCN